MEVNLLFLFQTLQSCAFKIQLSSLCLHFFNHLFKHYFCLDAIMNYIYFPFQLRLHFLFFFFDISLQLLFSQPDLRHKSIYFLYHLSSKFQLSEIYISFKIREGKLSLNILPFIFPFPGKELFSFILNTLKEIHDVSEFWLI